MQKTAALVLQVLVPGQTTDSSVTRKTRLGLSRGSRAAQTNVSPKHAALQQPSEESMSYLFLFLFKYFLRAHKCIRTLYDLF